MREILVGGDNGTQQVHTTWYQLSADYHIGFFPYLYWEIFGAVVK